MERVHFHTIPRKGPVQLLTKFGRVRPHIYPIFRENILIQRCSSSFACITGQSVLASPITYVSDSIQKRVPRADSEDTWSVVVAQTEENNGRQLRWVLGESVGKWDSRFG